VKSVVINSDASIGYLEEYKGHVLLGLREMDAGTAVKPEKQAFVLEFSTDKAEEYFEKQLLTPEEQKEVLRCYRERAMHGHKNAYYDLHITLGQRFCPDVDGGE